MGRILSFIGGAALMVRYRVLRERMSALQNTIVATLDKTAIQECGRRLGILKKNTLIFEAEHELAVLMDYCIYDYFRDGRNAVERYFAEHPPRPRSDEEMLSEAMIRACYRVLEITSVERGIGIRVRSETQGETLLLVDRGLSRTAPVGGILATRTISVEGFSMTTGAPLPVWAEIGEEIVRAFEGRIAADCSRLAASGRWRAAEAEFSTAVIRACLAGGTSSAVAYQDPSGSARFAPQPSAAQGMKRSALRGASRNSPCPCGSGRKYKKCCARR